MHVTLKPLEIETWCKKQKVRAKNSLSDGIISFDLEGIFQGQKSKFRKIQIFEMLITLNPLEIETCCNEQKVRGETALSDDTIRFDLERIFQGQKSKFRKFENFQMLITPKPLDIETWFILAKS